MKLVICLAAAILCCAFASWAQTPAASALFTPPDFTFPDNPQKTRMNDSFTFKSGLSTSVPEYPRPVFAGNVFPSGLHVPATQVSSRPKAVSFSRGYDTRRKIHKYASIATLPLAISEAIVGQKLIDSRDDDSLRSAHSALAAGIGVLFGVESVTGVWNLWESRKISSGRGKRMFHGILMLAADAGFVATAALAPHHEDEGGVRSSDASTHRAVAYASFGVATVSYVYMLFAK